MPYTTLFRSPLHHPLGEDEARERRSILDVPGQRECALRYRHVIPARDRPEVVELDLIQPEGRFDGRVGLGEEIRVAVEPERPCVEHEAFDVNVGGIDALFGSDVPDVLGGRGVPTQEKRLERASIEIGQIALAYLEPV